MNTKQDVSPERSVYKGAEALVAGILPTNLGPSISQQDSADLRVAFQPEGGSRPNSCAHGHPEIGTMSAHGTNVWTGCCSQAGIHWIAEVAHMYPACLIGSRAFAMGLGPMAAFMAHP